MTDGMRFVVGGVQFYVSDIMNAQKINDLLEGQEWIDLPHGEQCKVVPFKSDFGDVGLIHFQPKEDFWACALCGKTTETNYMLKDEVWAKAGLKDNDLACPVCVARALGRPLAVGDFTEAPINDLVKAMTVEALRDNNQRAADSLDL